MQEIQISMLEDKTKEGKAGIPFINIHLLNRRRQGKVVASRTPLVVAEGTTRQKIVCVEKQKFGLSFLVL